MISVHNMMTGEIFRGETLEFFIDEDTQIGEVYLDGDLIYQCLEKHIADEDDLELEFNRIFEVSEYTEDAEDTDESDPYDTDYYM